VISLTKTFLSFLSFFLFIYCFHSLKLLTRIDECKDRIRGVLKGRLPPEKDMKREIVQALRSCFHLSYYF